jgi:N-methylhydantoinase B
MALSPSCFAPETAPAGVCGGRAAPPASARILLANGETVAFDGPTLYRPRAGDVLDVYSTGGGGYGDPRGRSRAAILDDVAAGLLSAEQAARDYGVVVDPETSAAVQATAATPGAGESDNGRNGARTRAATRRSNGAARTGARQASPGRET